MLRERSPELQVPRLVSAAVTQACSGLEASNSRRASVFTLTFIACAINKQSVLFRPASPFNDMSGCEGLNHYSWNGSQSDSSIDGRGGEILWHMQSLRLPRRCEAPRRPAAAREAPTPSKRCRDRRETCNAAMKHPQDRRRVTRPPTRYSPAPSRRLTYYCS